MNGHSIQKNGDEQGDSCGDQTGLIAFHTPDNQRPEDEQDRHCRYQNGQDDVGKRVNNLFPDHEFRRYNLP